MTKVSNILCDNPTATANSDEIGPRGKIAALHDRLYRYRGKSSLGHLEFIVHLPEDWNLIKTHANPLTIAPPLSSKALQALLVQNWGKRLEIHAGGSK